MNTANDILDMIRDAQAKVAELSARLERMEVRQTMIDKASPAPIAPSPDRVRYFRGLRTIWKFAPNHPALARAKCNSEWSLAKSTLKNCIDSDVTEITAEEGEP